MSTNTVNREVSGMHNLNSFLFLLTLAVFLIGCNKDVSVSPPDEPPPDGYIFIESMPPGAQIYLEGKNRRRATPDSITWLETGIYRFALKKKYFMDTSFTHEVVEDERRNIVINYLENPKFYGRLECNSRPQGCDIYLNDTLTGEKTPHIFNGIMPGLYKITYKKEGYSDKSLNIGVWSNRQSDTVTTLIDTTKWKHYNTSNTMLPTNNLTCLEPDQDGGMWIGSTGKGLIYRSEYGTYINYSKSNSEIANDHITGIAIDNMNEPWVSTYGGPSRFVGRKKWSSYYPNDERPLPNSPLLSVDTKLGTYFFLNEAWFTASEGIYYYRFVPAAEGRPPDSAWIEYNTELGVPDYPLLEITIDGKGDKWVASQGGGVVRVRGYYTIESFSTANSGLPSNDITAISSYGNQIWAACATFNGTKGGTLAYFQDGDWYAFVISDDDNLKEVRDLFIDNKGNVWAATNLGVYVAKGFDDIIILNEESTGLDLTDVIEMNQDVNGAIWMATSGSGLFKYMEE